MTKRHNLAGAIAGFVATLVLAACSAPAPAPSASGGSNAPPAVVNVPTQPTIDPREQGLLVGVIAGSAVAGNSHERLWFLRAVLKINGTSYLGAVGDGNVLVPLKAGDYELQSVETQKHPSDKNLTAYPLNIKFRIQAGRATNLGLIALTRQPGEGKFARSIIDDTAELTAQLRRDRPDLFNALDPQSPVIGVAGTAYIKPDAVEKLRRDIARDAFTRTDNDPSVVYTFGEVGTIAKTLRDSQQRVVGFEALPTGTTARMFSCTGQNDRFVCSSSEPALYLVHATKVEKVALPAASRTWWVDAFAPAGIVLVDENMSIFRSRDDGRTWSKSSWFAVKQPLASTTRIKAYNGKSGFYLYSLDKIDPLAPTVLFSSYGHEGYSRIDLPDLSVWDSLIEVGDALAVGPVYSNAKDKSLFYLRPPASAQWEERQLPDVGCISLQRAGDGGDMTVLCSRKRYRSHDQGRSWIPDDSGPTTVSLN